MKRKIFNEKIKINGRNASDKTLHIEECHEAILAEYKQASRKGQSFLKF